MIAWYNNIALYVSHYQILFSFCYPKNWVRLLEGVVKPKDATKPKGRRRKDLLLAASKGNAGDLSQSSVSLNSKIVVVSS